MDEKKELEGLQEGDKVWSPIHGNMEVERVGIEEYDAGMQFKFTYKDKIGKEDFIWAFDDGRKYAGDKHPSVFRNEESFRRYWEMEYTGDGDDSPKEEPSIDPEIIEELMDSTDSLQEEVHKMMIADAAFKCAGAEKTGDLIGRFALAVDSHRYNLHKEIRKLKEEDKDESN